MGVIARNNALSFNGVILEHTDGGIVIQLIQRNDPGVRPVRVDFALGDIGLSGIVLGVADLGAVREAMRPEAEVLIAVDGINAFLHDPEGNLIRLVSDGTSGFRGVMLGVSNIQRSQSFYQEVLGFGCSSEGTIEVTLETTARDKRSVRGEYKIQRIKSASGSCWLELVQQTGCAGRSIPFGTSWGDYGYLQTCFSCSAVSVMAVKLSERGYPLLIEPHPAGAGPVEDVGEFVYANDPDGILIECLFLPEQK
jgi:catechol 2,3-dioxygenase-like lactoylglutathione lyase family enzyme